MLLCSYGPVQSRHHGIRDALGQIALQAGWHVAAEQEVIIGTEGAPSQAEAADLARAPAEEPRMKSADLILTNKQGQRTVVHVRRSVKAYPRENSISLLGDGRPSSSKSFVQHTFSLDLTHSHVILASHVGTLTLRIGIAT